MTTATIDVAPIRAAVTTLAAVCDGAIERDGQGFDGMDTKFGHRLAALDDGEWTPEMARAAWEMLHKYRTQLAGHGVDVDALPEPPDVPDFRKSWSRQDARIRLKERERAAQRKITVDGDRFRLAFPYDAALVAATRSIPGRTYDGATKTNLVPFGQARLVEAFAERHGFTLDDEARAALAEYRDREPAPLTITVRVVRGSFHLAFPMDRDLNASAKTLPGCTFAREPEPGWAVPTSYADEVIDWLSDKRYTVDASAGDVFAEATAARELRLASMATDADLTIEGLGGELMPFQRAGVAYALRQRRVFIADEMGLGKTVQALATLQGANAFPATIVCPSSLRLNWAREARKWLPNRDVQVIEGTRPQFVWADIAIVNYDVIHTHLMMLSGRRALVLDESHMAKNPRARRTQACIELASTVDERGVVLNLTGTPVLNRPKELLTQLAIIGRLDDLGGGEEFTKRYGHGRNLAELNARMRSGFYVRRKKADVLTDLPDKRRVDVFVEPDPEVMAEYRAAESDIVRYLAERAREIAAAIGEDPDSAEVDAAMRAESAKHLVAISTLKQLAARAKMKAADEWIAQFTDAGSKLVVFGHHRAVVDEVSRRHGGLRIAGDDPLEARQAAVDRFQSDDSAQVISCSLRAAGVGITLTAASDVAFIEQGWTPGEHDQAEDRCHRIGQRSSVTAWYLLAQDTIDEWVYELIADKRVVVDAATEGQLEDDDDPAMSRASVAGDLLVRLAHKGLEVAA